MDINSQAQVQIQTHALEHYLQTLKLPTIRASYKQTAEESLKLGS
jgi:hypothetical protein